MKMKLVSADNGVYILECKDQFRVAHLQAIDNIRWSFIKMDNQCEPVSTRVVQMFGKQKHTRNRNVALKVASAILRSLPVCEYGISFICINKRWNQVIKDAMELAVEELKIIDEGNKWDYEKQCLQELLNSSCFGGDYEKE